MSSTTVKIAKNKVFIITLKIVIKNDESAKLLGSC